MGYNGKRWKRRIAERTDLSSQIVHLVRENGDTTSRDVLMKILRERRIRGSDPGTGFISGNRPAVCFQDAPLSGICQNVFYEQKYVEANPHARIRYRAVGLMFDKRYAFRAGARPVIYDRPSDAKEYLPPEEWWRIVNFDLDDEDHIIDWSHEREWRTPGDFQFELSEATIILVTHKLYRDFVRKMEQEFNGIGDLKGIVVLDNILY